MTYMEIIVYRWQAFVKARGDGLGFDLGRVQFQLSAPMPSGSQSATAKVDGNLLLRCPAWLVISFPKLS